MPRFKLKGALERSAAGDLWKHTLSHVPTTIGRLAYLASLRDPNSGIYRHHGLTSVFGQDESRKALQESHEQTFLEWITLTMKEKHLDLSQYLAGIEEVPQFPPPTSSDCGNINLAEHSVRQVVEHWLRTRIYRTQIPSAASEMERELFCRDLEALLEIIKSAGGASSPVSSRPE